MSKQKTPCEKLGYKVGDKFKVVDGTGVHYAVGSFITLIHDDGSSCPRFNGVHAIFESGDSFFPLDFVEKVAKLKPAKQALADAIHQNGGWRHSAKSAAQCKSDMTISFYRDVPDRNGDCWCGDHIDGVDVKVSNLTNNRHQCILSRDKCFTAYPERKVEIINETKHKVEVEMKSESEVTIKVSDWHKNGELPPVGDVCEWLECSQTGWQTVTVAGYYLNAAWLVPKGKEPITVYNPTGFRPLRTERDNAIDEMMEHCDYLGSRDFAGKLFDAGYRKEVK